MINYSAEDITLALQKMSHALPYEYTNNQHIAIQRDGDRLVILYDGQVTARIEIDDVLGESWFMVNLETVPNSELAIYQAICELSEPYEDKIQQIEEKRQQAIEKVDQRYQSKIDAIQQDCDQAGVALRARMEAARNETPES